MEIATLTDRLSVMHAQEVTLMRSQQELSEALHAERAQNADLQKDSDGIRASLAKALGQNEHLNQRLGELSRMEAELAQVKVKHTECMQNLDSAQMQIQSLESDVLLLRSSAQEKEQKVRVQVILSCSPSFRCSSLHPPMS